ncbi:MAG: PIG-L family deacetylase [Gemmatimonadales bacterium]|nr:PIG-L family deacetylase [Gemmatimonadales bacterium]
MLSLAFDGTRHSRTILCLGAHSDDIEIGCGGTILRLLSAYAPVRVVWVVFSAEGVREREARSSAARFLAEADTHHVVINTFRDGFFPFEGAKIKDVFEEVVRNVEPDVIFTHSRDDRHQDHRLISDLTWQTFRDHLILEYEVPKYDGDLGRPNCYVPLSASHCKGKIAHLMDIFGSQRGKGWFTEETFRGLMRLRGIECASASGWAEAFTARKLVIGIPSRD